MDPIATRVKYTAFLPLLVPKPPDTSLPDFLMNLHFLRIQYGTDMLRSLSQTLYGENVEISRSLPE